MAGQKNWDVDQDTTFTFVVEYRDPDDSVIDLTGATAKMQVRDATAQKLAFTLTSPGGGITINGELGKVTVRMTPTQTKKLFYPKSIYDLIVTDSNLVKTKLLGGYITLRRTVTI
jgi:hypothetical protein